MPSSAKASASRRRQKIKESKDPEYDSEEDEYEVERIVKKVIQNGRAMYEIKWVGWSETDNTMEPEEHLTNCKEMLAKFETQWKEKQAAAAAAAEKKPGPAPARGSTSSSNIAGRKDEPVKTEVDESEDDEEEEGEHDEDESSTDPGEDDGGSNWSGVGSRTHLWKEAKVRGQGRNMSSSALFVNCRILFCGPVLKSIIL